MYSLLQLAILFSSFQLGVSQNSTLPCIFYDADTGQVVTNYTSIPRLKVDCSEKGLLEVPDNLPENTYIVLLGQNKIKNITANVFIGLVNVTSIDLSGNQITNLSSESFRNLVALESLNLVHNQLCLPHGYHKGVFKDLTSLKILKTFPNVCPSNHSSYPDDKLKHLISLEQLSLNVAENFHFGPGFQNLKHLTKLEASSSSEESSCESDNISIKKESFRNLAQSNISDLALRGCAFRTISPGAFDYFPRLKTLNLACTKRLDSKATFEAIYSMPNATLETFILDGGHKLGKSSTLNGILKIAQTLDSKLLVPLLRKLLEYLGLGKELQPFCHPSFDNLKRLSLRGSLLYQKLGFVKDREVCAPNLHHINIGMNPIFFLMEYVPGDDLKPFLKEGIPSHLYWSLNNIRTVDVTSLFDSPGCTGDADPESYFATVPKVIEDVPDYPTFNVSSGHVKSIPTKNGTHLHGDKGVAIYQYISPGTQVLIGGQPGEAVPWVGGIRKDCPYIVYPTDVLAFIDFSHTNVSQLYCQILGIKSLKGLDVSYCQIYNVHPDILKKKYVPDIELVYLGGNALNSTELPELFSEATSLRELDLSDNGFYELPHDSFINLSNLEKLDLSNNKLSSPDLLISHMTKFNTLDLSLNSIESLTEFFQKQLEMISGQNQTFILKLEGNPFACNCLSLQFLTWIQQTSVNIENLQSLTCINEKSTLLHVDTVKLAHKCKVSDSRLEYYIIIGSLSTFVMVVLITSITAYRKRWTIAWHWYIMKRKMLKNSYDQLVEPDKIYDAFVSYHIDHEDPDEVGLPWVTTQLKDYIENMWGKSLFIFDRDAELGKSKIGETIFGLKQSRKVILVLTETFLKKGNWEMVLHWALEQGLGNTIICCLGGLNVDQLPRSLAKVAMNLQKDFPTNYLEFSAGEENEAVWTSLKMALEDISAPEQ